MSDAELIKAYLAGRDVSCPECGYCLRGLGGAACPECGLGLSVELLRPARAQPLPRMVRVAQVGLALGAVEGAIAVAMSLRPLVTSMPARHAESVWAMVARVALAGACVVGLLAWGLVARRLGAWSARRQAVVAGVCWGLVAGLALVGLPR